MVLIFETEKLSVTILLIFVRCLTLFFERFVYRLFPELRSYIFVMSFELFICLTGKKFTVV